jgi:hypothetical protein
MAARRQNQRKNVLFLKKRTKKLLSVWFRAVSSRLRRLGGAQRQRWSKSFLLLFFKKEGLPSFVRARYVNADHRRNRACPKPF